MYTCVCSTSPVVGAGVAACMYSHQRSPLAAVGSDRPPRAPTHLAASHDGGGAAGITQTQIRCAGRPCGAHELADWPPHCAHPASRPLLASPVRDRARCVETRRNHVIMAGAWQKSQKERPSRGLEDASGEVESAAALSGENIAPLERCRKHVSM